MKFTPALLARIRPACLAAIALVALPVLPRLEAAEPPKLTLKANDVWVMAGDSITAQRLHTSFIEAYYLTRYPELNLHFRNSGIGGNQTSHVLQRFDYDIAAWKPTIVSVELGMNDVNRGDDPAAYIKGMREIIEKIRAIPAQPVLISSSPVDDGSVMGDWKSDRCRRIDPYTEALKKLAEETGVIFVDQYHPLVTLWGENRRKGAEIAAKNPAPAKEPAPATPEPAPGAPAAKPKAPELPPSLIPLGGNPVHPGAVGQYTMAATILAGLKADGAVSSATLKADGTVVSSKRCKISDASTKGGKLTFTRLDEVGPWPILPKAKSAAEVLPSMLDLSQYLLQVTGLPEGRYRVNINGKPAAVVEAKQLAAGWNITTAFESVLGERADALLALITKLQTPLNNTWRAASKAKDEAKLAAAQKAIEECEAQIRAAAKPVPLQFEIEREAL